MILDYNPDDLDVSVSELLVATHEAADPMVDPRVSEVLAMLREKLQMDVIFVSQFSDNQQKYKSVDKGPNLPSLDIIAAGNAYELEKTWCQQVVDGRVPEFMPDAQVYVKQGKLAPNDLGIGTFFSTPVLMDDGQVYGTLCCLSLKVSDQADERDLKRLQWTARLLAEKVQR